MKIQKKKKISIRLLCSYLAIILAPAVAIFVIYITMQEALLDIQKEKAQNLSKEAAVTFNKEIDQMVNVGKYISSDFDLKKYMAEREDFAPAERYYKAYELAKSYPNYAVLNRFIRNIYILPVNTDYIIQIPQVMPNNSRGVSVLDIVNSDDSAEGSLQKQPADGGVSYEEMVQSLYDMGTDSLVYSEGQGISDNFLILQSIGREGIEKGSGIVAIEIEKSQIKSLLHNTLGSDKGAAFLTDKDGTILYVYDQLGGKTPILSGSLTWKKYMEEIGFAGKSMTINRVETEYNNWSVITVIPQKELLSKIGAGKYFILLLCVASILIGIAICLLYWNRNQPVLDRYLKFTEKYPEKVMYGTESTNIWKNFGGVLDHVENLQLTVEKQKQWVMNGILRKILYGSYDSREELDNEISAAGVTFPIQLPCFVAALDIENPIKQELGTSFETLEETLRENLDDCLPYSYLMVCMNPLNYTLLIFTGDEVVEGSKMKQLFEKMNYKIYSQMPINIFTGISGPADTILAISEEYEHVCRICDYAKYYKLRTPFLLEDLPRHQHVVFTVELEMQLEKTVKSGTGEQLTTLMTQVKENYLNIPGGGYKPASQNLEMLRCILLRCLDVESPEEQSNRLLDQVHHARTPREMEDSIWAVWKFFADGRLLRQDQNEEMLKKEIEEKIEQEYSGAEFNLAIMADWLKIPEKKLYRDFKKMYGVSFSSYLEMLRIRHAQEFLKEKRTVQEVAAAVGYGSDYSFRRAFKRVVGVTPSDYQKMQ